MKDPTCYLCGKMIETSKERISGDHVPPKQFFPKDLREKLNPDLIKLPTHVKCNISYQRDEDYFVSSLGPMAADSLAGIHLMNDLEAKMRRPETTGLLHGILSEFDPNPSGLYLPNDKVKKVADKKRVFDIIWKIARGFHFNKYNSYLPIETRRRIFFLTKDDPVPDYIRIAFDTPIVGEYPAIFAYRYKYIPEWENTHFWTFFFWDHFIFPVFYSLSPDSPY